MNVGNSPVTIGETLYLVGKTPSGKVTYKAAKVRDLNEHVKMVKVEYAKTVTAMKSEWFPASMFVRELPPEEINKQ